MNWEDELASFAKGYKEGEDEVRKRRASWAPSVEAVLLLTLEKAAATLRDTGLTDATAKRHTFGDLESVQLYLRR